MPTLTGVSITFHTHNQGKDHDTILHVFVKNRLNTTQDSEQNTDFVSNFLGYQRYLDTGDLSDHSSGPYLAYAIGLGSNDDFGDPSTRTFKLTLMPDPVSLEDIVLPVVNVHIQPNGNNRWAFDYDVKFTFDDDTSFTFSSKDAGLPGVLLDQDNKNYSGVCAENPLRPLPVKEPLISKASLRKITLDFRTHNDDKDDDTRLDVKIVNRENAGSSTAIAVGEDLFPGVDFADGGPVHSIQWPSDDGNLSLNPIPLADMVLPEVNITIDPNGNDRWIFDYRVTFEFADPDDFNEKPMIFSSRTNGVILDQDNNKHSGVYQGPAFPEVAARPAPPLAGQPLDQITRLKTIPLTLLRRKFDEFINDRNGTSTDQNPPLRRIRLHNTGTYHIDTLAESYLDVQSITAGRETVNYVSAPSSLGQLSGFLGLFDSFLQDINSGRISVATDTTQPAPFTVSIDFETEGLHEVKGFGSTMDFLEFSISLRLTLDLARSTDASGNERTVVDMLSWIPELQNMKVKVDHVDGANVTFLRYTGTFLGQPVDLVSPESLESLFLEQVVKVHLVTGSALDPGGVFRKKFRDKIFDKLKDVDAITQKSARDGINSSVTSLLLGGVADDERNTDDNNTVINSIGIENDDIVISYTGPRNVFVFDTPADWPTSAKPNPAWDFSPGTLSNIRHIVVLTMENRSFDHMLGYLSLPVAQGGLGRPDVDGLKGGESNVHRGTVYPSFPLTDTFFSPDPPHGFEPVHRAINGGLMDGFVKAYAEQNGTPGAGQIMGHHTARTVPVFDALARDFAIGHRWFASHPGPTFPNRYYELTGRPNLDTRGFWEFDDTTPRPVFTKTIFDHLSEATDPATGQPVTWAHYEHGYCFLRLFERRTFDNDNIVSIDDPERGFFARAHAGNLPNVTFIDPHFVELPPGANADGPPADVKDGQDLVRRVVEAVVTSPAWDDTLLVVVYDEHGGFYDHVPPSAAARISPEVPIDTHGVRVPAFVISPWVGAGTVFGHDGPSEAVFRRNDLHFDHTSILRTIVRRFMSTNPPYLGARFAAANDLSSVVTARKRPSQFRPFIPYNFQFGTSQLRMGVKDASPAPGAPLELLVNDGSAAQEFAFEDAGNGFFYIRSRASNLYLTVHLPERDSDDGQDTEHSKNNLAVIQDVKFVPGTTHTDSDKGFPAGDRQKWSLRPVDDDRPGSDLLIRSRAVPGKILRPADTTHPSPIIVGNPAPGGPKRFTWKVTSPLLAA